MPFHVSSWFIANLNEIVFVNVVEKTIVIQFKSSLLTKDFDDDEELYKEYDKFMEELATLK